MTTERTELATEAAASSFAKGQVLNIFKPEGWTSFDVVKKIRSTVGVKKVGHAGTLDPFATGVLLLCTGKATKKVAQLMPLAKVYLADIELGKATDTYDRTGKTTAQGDWSVLDEKTVAAVCKTFVGTLQQIPPMFSALKQDGKRLYALARKGIAVDRPARQVEVHHLKILSLQLPLLSVEVKCSKGTYVRSLAHDIGQALGCGAHLKELCRTRIGPYRIEDSIKIGEFASKYRCLH